MKSFNFHNYKPRPQIFESSNSVLLANVANNWRLSCSFDSFPRPLNGLSFVLLNLESLCECQINIGESCFIPKSRTGCTKKKFGFKIQYPINSLMMYNLRHKIKNLTTDFDYYQTRDKNFMYNMPGLRVKHMVDDTRVLYDKPPEGVEIEKVVDLISSNEEALMTANDLIIENGKISAWFDKDSVENTVIFISSLLSISVFCIIGVCNYASMFRKA